MKPPSPSEFHRRWVRMQLRSQQQPQRASAAGAVLGGALFAVAMALVAAAGPDRAGGPWWVPWVSGLAGGVCFAAVSWAAARRRIRRTAPGPLPPGTGPDRVIAARRLLARGARSDDPETDRVVVHLARRTASGGGRAHSPTAFAWWGSGVFVLALGANLWVLLATGDPGWIHYAPLPLFAVLLALMPAAVRTLRGVHRVAEDAAAEGPGAAEGGSAGDGGR